MAPRRGNSTKREMRKAKSAQDPDRQVQTISVGSAGPPKPNVASDFLLLLALSLARPAVYCL